MAPDRDLTPPVSPEAEASLLGALLLDPTALDRIGALSADDFFIRGHRALFKAVSDMVEQGLAVDPLTVAEHLEASGQLDNVGGLSALVALADGTPSAANAPNYARIVRDRSKERGFLAALSDATAAVYARQGVDAAFSLVDAAATVLTSTQAGDAQPARALIEDFRRRMSERAAGRLVGTPTGFDDVDRLLGGLKPGQLVVLAARPAQGKSALAGAIAHRNARNGRPVAVFSLEMSSAEVLDRLVALEAGIPLAEITSGRPRHPSHLTNALESIRRWPLHIDDTPSLSVREIRRRSRALHRRQPLSIVVVDYLQLVSTDGETRNLAIEAVSRGLKALAKELGVPVLALAQLSRALESRTDRRPLLSDLRDSGGIEQDADVVLMLHREEVFRSDPGEWRGLAELLVRKNRQGPTGEIRLSWRSSHAAFDQHDGARWPETRVSSPRRRAFE